MTKQYSFDTSHSNIGFWVRHLVVSKVHGNFTRWSGSMNFDETDPASASVDVTIEAGSIDTREPKRDEHLRSADFFDVANHPELRFRSTKIEQKSLTEFTLHGDLTIRGTTRPVALQVESLGQAKDPWGNTKAGFSARTTINRKDFGLTWNQALETGGVLVGEKIEIELDVQAAQSIAAAA
jgi:polyisoprenoid-binding protein YceI